MKIRLEVDHYKSLVFEALALQRIVLVQWIKFITVTYTPPAKSINTMQDFTSKTYEKSKILSR